MRRILCHTAVLLSLVLGCRTAPVTGDGSRGAVDDPLTDEERAFAGALAHYTRSLIEESASGWDAPEVLHHLERALALDPGSYRLYARAAAIHLQGREIERALDVLREACRRNPNQVQAWSDLASTCEAANLSDEAAEHGRRAIRLSPGNAQLYCQLAGVYFKVGRDAKGLAVIREGLRRAERPPVVMLYAYNTGVEFVASRQLRRAAPCFEAILGLDPLNSERLHLLLGEIYDTLNDTERAIAHMQQATDGLRPGPGAFTRLAALRARTDAGKALKALERGIARYPDDASLRFSLGLLQTQEERFDAAIASFGRARDLIRTEKEAQLSPGFYLHFGAAHERSGRIQEAAGIFQECLRAYPDEHSVLNYLAYMWAEAGIELDSARQHVTRALQLAPNNGAYLDTLGWVHYKQKRYEEALAQILQASERLPDDPTILDHLGDVYLALGKSADALARWRESYVLDPKNRAVETKLKTRGEDLRPLLKRAKASAKTRGERESGEGDAGDASSKEAPASARESAPPSVAPGAAAAPESPARAPAAPK
jgi:tetratricopeptide (TPR) repeat protein